MTTAASYKCEECGATGVKLWRAAYSSRRPVLKCINHFPQDKIEIFLKNGITAFEWYVPAIVNNTVIANKIPVFWPVCFPPEEDAKAWRALPTGYKQ